MDIDNNLLLLVESLLLAANKPLSVNELKAVLEVEDEVIKAILGELQQLYQGRAVELIEVASGYRFQIIATYAPYIAKLWEEKTSRYSKALLETLALIAYRQPITRGEIEEIRGVSVAASIFKTLLEEREWIRVVGHKDVPGRPALYATTKAFLDYFGLKSLEQLPLLAPISDITEIAEQYEKTSESNQESQELISSN